jgi:transposase-like protein
MAAQQAPSAPSCPVCRMPMGLVFIEPKVASFAELQIFRCFACGRMRSIEQKINPYNQANVTEARPSFFD